MGVTVVPPLVQRHTPPLLAKGPLEVQLFLQRSIGKRNSCANAATSRSLNVATLWWAGSGMRARLIVP